MVREQRLLGVGCDYLEGVDEEERVNAGVAVYVDGKWKDSILNLNLT